MSFFYIMDDLRFFFLLFFLSFFYGGWVGLARDGCLVRSLVGVTQCGLRSSAASERSEWVFRVASSATQHPHRQRVLGSLAKLKHV